MRIDPPPEAGIRYERAGPVVRALGDTNGVAYARLTAGSVDRVIVEQVAFFRLAGPPIEWKVYGHDRPSDLGARLAAAGFAPEEPETLMIFDLAEGLRQTGTVPDTAIVIRRVADAVGLADAMRAAATAFGRDATWQAERITQYGSRLADPALGLYVAYVDGRPVASARAEFPCRRSFAGLWGGGTLPQYRGRGIYRLLVAARAREARERGYRYLRVDARDTSRPILERLGFVALTPITEWRLPFPGPARPA